MNFKISNLRIFAILSVVFGHSIIIYSSTWNLMKTDVASPLFDALKTGINFYQMELYFFIAGFLVYHSLQKNVSVFTFIKKKAIRLLIPYLVFGFLWMIPIKIWLDIPGYHGQKLSDIVFLFLTGRNTGHLWFLLALFEIMLFLYPEAISKVLTIALKCSSASPSGAFSAVTSAGSRLKLPEMTCSKSFFKSFRQILLKLPLLFCYTASDGRGKKLFLWS